MNASRLLIFTLVLLPGLLGTGAWVVWREAASMARGPCAPSDAPWLGLASPPLPAGRADLPPLRAVTYNLRSGLGPAWRPFDARSRVEARLRNIARSIAEAAPAASPVDVVGLNEVDFHSRRSGWLDQAAFIADQLALLTGNPYEVLRGETWSRHIPGLEVRFGNALLVRHPIVLAGADLLEMPEGTGGPGPLGRVLAEPRGVVHARILFHGQPLEVLVTHLEPFAAPMRLAQAAEVVRRIRSGVSTVVLGDFNTVPFFTADPCHDLLTAGPLQDPRAELAAGARFADLASWATYPSRLARWPLDAILATADLAPLRAVPIGGEDSDHLGFTVDYRWLGEEDARGRTEWHHALHQRQLARFPACGASAQRGVTAKLF